jgi:hypothetical protein
MHDPDSSPLGASYRGSVSAEAPRAKAEVGTGFG